MSSKSDSRRKNVAEDDARPSGAHRQRAAQEQSGADGASDGNHAQLALAELAGQTLLFVDRMMVTRCSARRDGPSLHRRLRVLAEVHAHKFEQAVDDRPGC